MTWEGGAKIFGMIVRVKQNVRFLSVFILIVSECTCMEHYRVLHGTCFISVIITLKFSFGKTTPEHRLRQKFDAAIRYRKEPNQNL